MSSNIKIHTATKRKKTVKNPKDHEKFVAESLGGRRTPASGAIEVFKGDVSDVRAGEFDFLVECKCTSASSMSIKKAWLEKIRREAEFNMGREPMLAFRYYDGSRATDWVAVPMETMVRMLETIREHWECVTGKK